MSTLDEITNEKQRITEALARVDAQREKLTGQLEELEATERVLARYSKGTQVKKTASARTPTTATKAAASARGTRASGALRPQKRLAASAARRTSTIRSLPWQPARRSRKSPLHARALARTMSAPRLPGTSELAASKSATGSSTPRSRRDGATGLTPKKKRRPTRKAFVGSFPGGILVHRMIPGWFAADRLDTTLGPVLTRID